MAEAAAKLEQVKSQHGILTSVARLSVYFVLGAYFGIVLAKSEAISWFRIQEMFRFQSFHMYGLFGSAVLVAMLSIFLLKGLKSWTGDRIEISSKNRTAWNVRYWGGGTIFGLGWALLGACPGPLYTLIGHGVTVYIVAFISALAGTWTYGWLRSYLPH